MPAPTISLATTGTDPKNTTKQELESEVNAALESLWNDAEALGNLAALDTVNTPQIDDNSINNLKLADMDTQTFKGRLTAGTGNPENLTAAQVRTILNIEDGATADQTAAQIKSAYEGEANTNAFTDAEKTKLGTVETSADVTDAANIGAGIHGTTAKVTIADGDAFALIDSESSNALAKTQYGNMRTQLLASSALTGTPTAPTVTVSDTSTKVATTAFVKAAISALVDSSPAALDTLNELAAALGDDPNFAATVNASIADRLRIDQNLADLGNVSAARANLGLGTAALSAATDFATAAQGTTADSAVQPEEIDNGVDGYLSQGEQTEIPILVDGDYNTLYSVDQDGRPYIPLDKPMATDDSPVAFALADVDGVPMIAADEDGSALIFSQQYLATGSGGADHGVIDGLGNTLSGVDNDGNVSWFSVRELERDTPAQSVFSDGGFIRKGRDIDALYTVPHRVLYDGFNDYIALWDALVTDYPDYITKTSLGNDRDGRAVYKYDFVPPEVQTDIVGLPEAPLVVIFNNIHGSERTGSITPLILARDLARNWRNDNRLSRLRWNARITFIPALCPYGVEETSRSNSAGVNLNRNFDYNHATAGTNDPLDDWNYRGPTPASEPETQYAQTLIDAVAAEAAVIIDCHNHTTFDANGYIMWTGSDDPESRRILANVSREMHGWLYRELPHLTDESIGLNQITECLDGSLEGYAGSVGARGVLFESVTDIGSSRADVMRANIETLLRIVDAFAQFDITNNTIGDV